MQLHTLILHSKGCSLGEKVVLLAKSMRGAADAGLAELRKFRGNSCQHAG